MLKEFRSIDVCWDKATRRIYEEIRSSSSDEKGRKLTVQIVNDGQIQDLTNVALNLYWETQDGENKGLDPFEPLDAENGVYELYFRTGMLKHAGKLNAHLHLVDTTGAITSEPFTIVVFSGVDVDAMASDDELSALNQALITVSQYDARIAANTQAFNDAVANITVDSEVITARSSGVKGKTFSVLDERLEEAEQDLSTHKLDYANYQGSNNLKIASVERELNDYKSTMASVNVNQEAKQSASGYGIVSLPKNAANGQVSVSVKGNTEVDDEGNTKSTISASRLKSVGKNLINSDVSLWEQGNIGVDGLPLASTSRLRTKNFIPIKPNTVYYWSANNVLTFRGYDKNDNFTQMIGSTRLFTTDSNTTKVKVVITGTGNLADLSAKNAQLELGIIETPYEPYTESTQYLPNVGELRSLPNGTKDEVRVSGGKAELVKRVSDTMEELAEPIITPIEVSGTLLSNPSGTVYVENVVADAGIYSDGLSVLNQDLPIAEIESISKVDFTTGVETSLDVSKVVVNGDKLSFTHSDLENGDIVFFTYFYDKEGTQGETTITYYDSRHTLKDTVTGKFYKVVPTVSSGVLTNTLVEV